MHLLSRIGFLTLLLLVSCASEDCLPEPSADATSPKVRIAVHYTPPGATTETTHVVTDADTSAIVRASRSAPVGVTFSAADSSGLRRLAPAVTVQHTVGIGVEREFAPIDAVTSSCPVPSLEARYTAHTSGEPRLLIVSALAENWTGSRSSIEPTSIRME